MFQSQFFLSKKGPLGSIWVAAYCLKRLHRDQIVQTNIPSSVDKILIDEWPTVTYRILAYLLLGVVRIYSKKVEFVLHDCREIINELNKFVGKKKAVSFREIVHAQDFSVTLPERYELDAFVLEYADDGNKAHIAKKEDIIIQGSFRNDKSVNCSVSKCHKNATAQGKTILTVSKTSTATIKLKALSSAQNAPVSPEDMGTCSTPLAPVENCTEFELGTSSSQLVRSFEESIEEFREIRFSREECLDFEMFYQNDKEHAGIFKSPIIIQSANVEHSELITMMQIENNGILHSEVKDETHTVERNRYSDMPSDNHDHVVTEVEDETQTVERNRYLDMPSDNLDHVGTEEKEANFTVQASPDMNIPSKNHKRFAVEDEGNFTDRSPDLKIASDDHKNVTAAKKVIIADLERVSQSYAFAPDTSEKGKIPLKVQITPDLKIPAVKEPGSIELLAVRTPANKERVRKANKRKCIYDDFTVLSNQTLKHNIDDPSDLVRKRRRVPHSSLAVWRQSCLYDPPQMFMEPLIPCNMITGIVIEPKDIQRKSNNVDQAETVDLPDNPVMAVSPLRSLTDGNLLAIAPGTPVRCSTSTRAFISPRAADSDGEGPSLSFQTVSKKSPCQLFENARKDFVADSAEDARKYFVADSAEEIVLDLMDKDMDENGDSRKQDGWSTRTRTIARWLRQVFANKTKCNAAKTANLSQILDGKIRKKSARIFYEILVLRSGEYVNVSQEGAYNDILLQETRKMERKLAKCSV